MGGARAPRAPPVPTPLFTPVNKTCGMKTCHIKFVEYTHVHLANETCQIKFKSVTGLKESLVTHEENVMELGYKRYYMLLIKLTK